ncbi:MAG TPA: nitrate/sulfonate/bicarbonate ABC transporter ATP-binding protein [Gammaproteobacteria bacterium]|nr:nitrate/sulfonate/bicarbonate ABC transporter ATP-binding protein [Gammaproteobacteria bacterium]
MSNELLRLDKIQKSFKTAEGQDLLVLENINFRLAENEIVALLGKSGSGKSTLLRIIAGLIKPTSGSAHYQERPITRPVQGISMVFQNFALMPWLTVLENVELGLEALGIPQKERRQKALAAIDTIGLDGFESAYPKELSGGMRQRVGFARALVVEPELLLMDEPFSALDILTAENLRNDLLDLWTDKRTQTKSILFVTHDIEEAIIMAHRILLFSTDPGGIQAEVPVNLPFPRETQTPEFRQLLDQIYTLMTISEREKLSKAKARPKTAFKHPEYAYRLPDVGVSELIGLLETMEEHENEGMVNLPQLGEELHLDVNDLFPLTDVLDMLCFAKISEGNIHILEAGKQFAAADILQRKHMFAKHLLQYIPLAHHIREVLDARSNHRVTKNVFLDELEDFLSEEESERLLRIIIDWGRYAEIFAYDYDAGVLSLENPI